MAQIDDFDATTVEPAAPFEIMPPGKYVCQIVKSDLENTKSGSGKALVLEFDVLEGPHKGRKLWDRLNLVNPSAQAVEIAQRALSAICHATGQMKVSDSDKLHFKALMVTVKVRPAGPDKQNIQREARNEIGGYEAVGGARAGASSAPAARVSPAARQTPVADVAPAETATEVPPAAEAPKAPWRKAKATV